MMCSDVMMMLMAATNKDGSRSRPDTTTTFNREHLDFCSFHINHKETRASPSFSTRQQRYNETDRVLNHSYLRETGPDEGDNDYRIERRHNQLPEDGFRLNDETECNRQGARNHQVNRVIEEEEHDKIRVMKRSAITQQMVTSHFGLKCPLKGIRTRTTVQLRKDGMPLNTIEMCHQPSKKRPSRPLMLFNLLVTIVGTSLLLLPLLPVPRVSASGASRQALDGLDAADFFASGQDPGFSPLRRQPSISSRGKNSMPELSRRDERFGVRSGEQPERAAEVRFEPKQAAATEGSSKFTRTNELDVFLDDMNHSELRAVATGKPIGGYLFQTRPLQRATGGQQVAASRDQHHELLRPSLATGQPPIQLVGGPKNHSSASSPDGRSLDESQSEQQIYSECALILQRTYVKNIDNPKHPELVPFGKTEQACIGYRHIDKAVEQAKHMLRFKQLAQGRKKQKPKLPPLGIIHKTLEPPQDLIAAIGELNMATTQILANQFDLSNDELLNGLPLIDMSKTKFWPLCPALVKQDIKCELSRYRTLTGHCNNLKHPTWGAAMTPFARYLPPVHPDGIWIPRKSIMSETVFDTKPGAAARTMLPSAPHPHHVHEPSQPRTVFGDPSSALQQLPPMMPPPPPPFAHHNGLLHRTIGAPSMDEHLSSSASVQFASHVRPEEAELASMMQQVHGGSAPLDSGGASTAPSIYQRAAVAATSTQRPIDGAISQPARHYHESHSPLQPYMAGSYPMSRLSEAPPQSVSPVQLLASEAQHHPHHHRQHQARSVALELPSARLVTSIVHRDVDLPNHDLSILFMSWGQLLDHDMTRAAQSPPSIKCCTPEDGKPKHKLCLPIQVPHDDPFYSKHNVQCLEFRRSLAGLRPNCVLGPRVHQNAITSPIDANFVYGSSQAQSEALRLFKGGRLRDRDWFKSEGLKPLLPAQEVEPDTECIARPKNLFCFLAGDVRVNEQTHLTVLHTIYMREHNRLADGLAHLNPHWDDERLFQETRHIVAAGVQHVMINEYIPLLVGKKMADLYNLTAVSVLHEQAAAGRRAGLHWHGYDASVTTSVSNSFAAAAFRQGHTFVQGSFERFNKFHEFVASERLRHLFKRPFLLYQPGVMDELVAGMINQASQSYDPFISEDISGHLFQPPELAFGHDLAAINLQRGREQGLPGYNLFREWCGLPRAETFDQLEPYLTNHTAFHYSRLYKHVDDIDLWSGGVSERKLPGAAIGPTFACIIARQFSNTRRGDRFWYENPALPSSFSPSQLKEIRKVTLAKILCANADDLPTFQRWALRLAHPVLNPRLPCDQLPQMDLRAWQEE